MTTQLQTNWRTMARCRLNPDLWTTRIAEMVRPALHICRQHCPVRQQCHAEAVQLPTYLRHEVVLGGVAYAGSGMPGVRQAAAEDCGSCRLPRRVEDEGQTPREMDEERARDEADRDAEQTWREERP